MARKLRIQHPGAIYYVMNRGGGREWIFHCDQNRESFCETLAEVCAKTGWPVHSFCLMPNHKRITQGRITAGRRVGNRSKRGLRKCWRKN